MSISISIATRDIFTANGEFDTRIFELQTESDDILLQRIRLESIDDLIAVRNAISAFVDSQPADLDTSGYSL